MRRACDLERLRRFALVQLGELLVDALVFLGGGLRLGGHLAVDPAPARYEQQLAARAKDAPAGVAAGRQHGGLDARVLEHGLRMEDRQEAPHDHVVDALVVVAHAVDRVLGPGGDDRVVVGDLLVVDDARERQHVEARDIGGRRGVLALSADELGRGLDLLDHVGRQVTRVGARIGERLVLLVQALRGAERAPRGEAVAGVGLALERREVVQHRRALALLLLVELGDRALLALARLDDRERLLLARDAGL